MNNNEGLVPMKMVQFVNKKTQQTAIFIPNDDHTIFAVMMPVEDIREWLTKPELIQTALDNVTALEREYAIEAEKKNVRVNNEDEEQIDTEAQS